MKTLHLTNAHHPTSGGIRHFYHALLGAAAGTRIQTRLVVPAAASSVEQVNANARIYRVRAPRSPVFDSQYRLLLPTAALRPGGAILRILREEQPDLVEVCDKYLLIYLAGAIRKGWLGRLKRPVLVGLSCERMDDNVSSYLGLGRIGRALSALYMRRIYIPQFDCHVANSAYTAAELQRQARRHPRPVRVLPMGVEADRFGPHRRTAAGRFELLERIGGSSRTRVLVYAGRLSSEKNVELLPRMFELLLRSPEDFRLVVAGGGPLAGPLAADCERRAPGRTTFLAHLDRESLADLLANADAFVHPNPREPFGIGPLEAMASGLPLVAPTTGGVTTYASRDSAWLAGPTPEEFASQVRGIFADPSARAAKTARALEVAARYRWDKVTGQFFATYERLVREATAPQGRVGTTRGAEVFIGNPCSSASEIATR